MPQEQWTAVDQYLTDLLVAPDETMNQVLQASAKASLPEIHVAPNQGKLLQLLAQTQQAKNILEIGTLGGYSTIWLARGLAKGGHLITLEFEDKHAQVARSNFAKAGLSDVIEVIVGSAIESLPKLAADNRGPFDMIFIDADKVGYCDYLTWSLRLSRPGTLIIADNVVRKGAVIDQNDPDPSVQGVRRFNELLSKEKRVSATAIQTVGSKGYDGLAIARVIS